MEKAHYLLEDPVWSKIYFHDEGLDRFMPCFAITIYFDQPLYSEVLDFFDNAFAALKPYLSYYSTGKGRIAVNKKSSEVVASCMQKPLTDYLQSYWIKFYGCKEGASESDLEIFMKYSIFQTPEQKEKQRKNWEMLITQGADESILSVPSKLRVSFPITHELTEPKKLFEWLKNLKIVKNGSFISGHAGYEVNIDEQYYTPFRDKKMEELSEKYPLLGWEEKGSFRQWDPLKKEIVPVIKRVHWMNLLGEEMTHFLGKEKLQQLEKDPKIKIHTLEKSTIIQIGDKPQLISGTTQDYENVAKILEPVQMKFSSLVGKIYREKSEYEWKKRWLIYFNK